MEIKLPAARILHVDLDEKNTKVWDRSKTWWAPWVPFDIDLEKKARLAALDSVKQQAHRYGDSAGGASERAEPNSRLAAAARIRPGQLRPDPKLGLLYSRCGLITLLLHTFDSVAVIGRVTAWNTKSWADRPVQHYNPILTRRNQMRKIVVFASLLAGPGIATIEPCLLADNPAFNQDPRTLRIKKFFETNGCPLSKLSAEFVEKPMPMRWTGGCCPASPLSNPAAVSTTKTTMYSAGIPATRGSNRCAQASTSRHDPWQINALPA